MKRTSPDHTESVRDCLDRKLAKPTDKLNVYHKQSLHLVHEPLEVAVSLLNKQVEIRKPVLCFKDTLEEVKGASLQIDEWDPSIPVSGRTFKIKINTLSSAHDGREFCIRVDAESPQVESGFSDSFKVFLAKIDVSIEDENPQKEFIFFNQMGGANNVITLNIHWTSKEASDSVELGLSLVYSDNNEPVSRKGILEVVEPPEFNSKGMAQAKLKIREVSSKHNNRRFAVKVAAHSKRDQRLNDVEATSRSILVKAKNTTQKKQQKAVEQPVVISDGVALMQKSVDMTFDLCRSMNVSLDEVMTYMQAKMKEAKSSPNCVSPSNSSVSEYLSDGGESQDTVEPAESQSDSDMMDFPFENNLGWLDEVYPSSAML